MIERKPEGRAVLSGVSVDADALSISFSDPLAQWGLGVFETIAVSDSSPCRLDDHMLRLGAAARRLGITLPVMADLLRAAHFVAASVGSRRAWLKVVVSRSGAWAVFSGPAENGTEGTAVSAVVLSWRRHRLDPTAGIKSTGCAWSQLGLEEARRSGADEGLILNERGHVVEACTANVFVARGRAVVTPSLRDGARDGVTRARAIKALREFGYSVRQSKVRMITLRAADEVFLTSSLRGVRPVVRIDGRDVRSGQPGPIARRLATRLTRCAGRDVFEVDGERQGA